MRRPARPRSVLSAVAAAAAGLVLVTAAGCGADAPTPDSPDPGPTTGAPAGTPDPPAQDRGQERSDEAAEVPVSLRFTGTTVAGEPFDAATLAGEPVVLWFWAPWCPLCRAAAPDVLAASEHVTVVGVGGLDADSAMQGFVDDTETGSLTHLSDPDGAVWQKFEVTTQDTYVLIDAAGEILFTGRLSGSELQDRAADLAG